MDGLYVVLRMMDGSSIKKLLEKLKKYLQNMRMLLKNFGKNILKKSEKQVLRKK